MLSAFSHPTRQAILDLLRRTPSTVGELASQLPVTRPAVSQHLQALREAGLVDEERRGTRHYFRLNPKSFAELHTHIEEMWRDALASFSAFAANQEKLIHVKPKERTRTHPAKRPRGLSSR